MKTPLSDLQALVIEAVLEKKAFNILVLDLRNRSDITDCFIICSGNSKAQVQAIVNSVLEKIYKTPFQLLAVEGLNAGDWVIVDIEDIFVHVFHKDVRGYYDLERLWGDVPVQEIEAVCN